MPCERIRALRSYTRLHEDHIRQSAMHVCLMQEALDRPNVKLQTVISQLLSRWPNENAFTAWLGLAPGKHQSGKTACRVRRRRPNAAAPKASQTRLRVGGNCAAAVADLLLPGGESR